MPIYSKPTKIAVRILSLIAEGKMGIHKVREVAHATGIPQPTAAKTLHMLARDGILESRKGPGGGYRLALPPKEVSLGRIVAAIEGKDPFFDCPWGFPTCSESEPCPLHDRWNPLKERFEEFLHTTTLHDVVRAMRPRGKALGDEVGIISSHKK